MREQGVVWEKVKVKKSSPKSLSANCCTCTCPVITRKATFISKFTSLRSFPACTLLLLIFFFRLIEVFNPDTKCS